MNAKEAARLSAENDRKIKADKAEKARKAKESAERTERKKRADFLIKFTNDFQDAIRYRVEDGEKSAKVYISPAYQHRDQAQSWHDNPGYKDLVEKVVAKFRREGYSVKQEIEVGEDNNFNPESYSETRYWPTYQACYKIEW